MQKLIAILIFVVLVTGCSSAPPKPAQPTGEWTPVNQPSTQKG